MIELLARLDEHRTMPLLEFLGQMRYRAEAVTAFLACLELIRLGVVRAFQTRALRRDPRHAHGLPFSRPSRYAILTASDADDRDRRAPEADAETPEPARRPRVEKILPALEAVLFSSPRPVREKDLADLLEATPEAVSEALETAGRPHRRRGAGRARSRRSPAAGASSRGPSSTRSCGSSTRSPSAAASRSRPSRRSRSSPTASRSRCPRSRTSAASTPRAC